MRVLFYCRGMEQLGVEYLMAFLERRGHEVELVFDPGLENNLYYRLEFLPFLNQQKRLVKEAVAFKPDLVAFSALTNLFPFALNFARLLRRELSVPFVFGGIHATTLPEYVLSRPEVDYVIRGEGEEALLELVTALETGSDFRGVKNLGYKENGQVRLNPLRPLIADLDVLPFPKKDQFFREGAFDNQLQVLSGRGCPFRCSYCVNSFYRTSLYPGIEGATPPVRWRSPENLMAELRYFTGRFAVDHVVFMDEVFGLDRRWLFNFLEQFKAEFKGLTFTFSYYHKFIDDEVAAKLAEAGGNFAQGAIETANPELRQKVLKRNETDEDILTAMASLKKHGIKTSTSAIFGLPFETESSRWETVRLVERSQPDMVNSYLLYPFPGTEIAQVCRDQGFLSAAGWEKVKQGLESYHQKSLLQNLDLDNAATMAKLLPLYIKGPTWLKPLVEKTMRKRLPRLSHFLYIVTAPILYSGWTRNWIRNLLSMFALALLGKKRKTPRPDPAGPPPDPPFGR